MKEAGFKTNATAEDTKYMQTGILIKDNTKTGSLMAKVFLHGHMVKFMMENGKMELKTDMEFGKEFQGILT